MTSQKQAVCNALLSTLAERGEEYVLNGETSIKSVLTKADYDQVRTILTEGFTAGEISLSDDAKAKHAPNGFVKYTNGLIKNWVKKNPEFNGGEKYVPKNPGSRAGSGDDQIRAMRALLKTTNDQAVIDEINKEIANRLAEIKPVQTVTIDVDKLPESLKHLVK